ncbi:hypothetical protein MHBO_000089 [Bonamia ostreae]|uniref:Secreted protein n=1 Tax=Bonamia ostreae TaxID=126728 RepID=A0ABV2AEB6_9EUKA
MALRYFCCWISNSLLISAAVWRLANFSAAVTQNNLFPAPIFLRRKSILRTNRVQTFYVFLLNYLFRKNCVLHIQNMRTFIVFYSVFATKIKLYFRSREISVGFI